MPTPPVSPKSSANNLPLTQAVHTSTASRSSASSELPRSSQLIPAQPVHEDDPQRVNIFMTPANRPLAQQAWTHARQELKSADRQRQDALATLFAASDMPPDPRAMGDMENGAEGSDDGDASSVESDRKSSRRASRVLFPASDDDERSGPARRASRESKVEVATQGIGEAPIDPQAVIPSRRESRETKVEVVTQGIDDQGAAVDRAQAFLLEQELLETEIELQSQGLLPPNSQDGKHAQPETQLTDVDHAEEVAGFRQEFLSEFDGRSNPAQLRQARAKALFQRTLQKHSWDGERYSLNYANELLAVYRAKVPPHLHADLDRLINTLEYHVLRGTPPHELAAKVQEGHFRDSWGVAGAVLYVFSKGFGMANLFLVLMAAYGQTIETDKYKNGIDMAVLTILIAALGGAWGGIVAAKAKWGGKYERAVVVKDRKSVNLQEHWTGKLMDNLAFTGFSIGHPIVDAHYRGSTDAAAITQAKALSAVASTFLAALIKSKGPHALATMDPLILNVTTPGQRRQVDKMMADLGQSRSDAVVGSMKDLGKAYKEVFGMPGARARTQAALHIYAVAVSLFVFFVPTFWPMNEEVAFRFKIAGGVLLGLLWGPFHKFGRVSLAAVEGQAVRQAAEPARSDVVAAKLQRFEQDYTEWLAQRERPDGPAAAVDLPVD